LNIYIIEVLRVSSNR